MTIGLYKYYHLVHNISSAHFHGNRNWSLFVYTKVSFFHSMKIIYFQKNFLKIFSIDFFFLFSLFWPNDIYVKTYWKIGDGLFFVLK